MTSILTEIYNYKKDFIYEQKKVFPENELIKKLNGKNKKRGLKKTIDENFYANNISIIAEVKKASPSKGIIANIFNPKLIAKNYQDGGATCISVLTDEKYFLGSIDHLKEISENSSIPIIRKDFIISEYQIFESKYIGADCILLIHSILSKREILNFYKLANELNLDVLIEVHNKEELLNIFDLDNVLIGINNRNLNTMKVDINNSIKLLDSLKTKPNLICESGIKSIDDIKKLLKVDFKSFLIGEFLMKSTNPKELLQNIFKLNRYIK